ncbi:MAG: DUF1854 domain-containing protein [Pirellula sp.]|jgi:hypothetical protein|nr:DUF1854 domain-containing protein [Pirellula sp.]
MVGWIINMKSTELDKPSHDSESWSEPKLIRFELDALGQLTLLGRGDARVENVRPIRLFPLSRPDDWIAILDATGREICCIEEMGMLEPDQRTTLEQELEKREFVPIVKRIVWVSGNSEPCEWKVETDRGSTSFILNDEKDVRRLSDQGVLVVDSFGIRYMIPNRNQLDSYSRRVVEWYV